MIRRFVLYLILSVFGTSLACAQSSETWVSRSGNDSNDCSLSTPCRTLRVAVGKGAVGGQVGILDQGDFGPAAVLQSMSIVAAGAGAGATVPGSTANGMNLPGFLIYAPQAIVSVRGFTFDGLGVGTNGIEILAAAEVHIEDCVFRNWTGSGVMVHPGQGATRVFLRGVSSYDNRVGLTLNAVPNAAVATLTDSSFAGNTDYNIEVNGPTASLILDHDAVLNGPGIRATGSPQVISFGNNSLVGVAAGVVTQTRPLQ